MRNAGDTFATHQQNLVWQLLGDTVIEPESMILDVGCGIGGPAQWIARRYRPRQIVGLEYCRASVERAHQLCGADGPSGMAFIQGDAHRLPVATGSVDVLFNLESALHYVDKPAFLAECRRVLRAGGALCLGDITSERTRWWSRVADAVRAGVHLWSTQQYRDGLRAAGFELLRHEDASGPVAASLDGGLAEVARLGFFEKFGVRGRCLFLRLLQRMFEKGTLHYDLFAARASGT